MFYLFYQHVLVFFELFFKKVGRGSQAKGMDCTGVAARGERGEVNLGRWAGPYYEVPLCVLNSGIWTSGRLPGAAKGSASRGLGGSGG